MQRRIGFGLLVSSALLAMSGAAQAAVQVNICIPARMAPAATTIPHNFPGFGYDAPNAQAMNVHLVDTSKGAAELPVTFGPVVGPWNKVVPQAGFTVGDTYTLTFDSLCYGGGGMALPEQKPITFTVVADAPLPTMLGDVMGTPSYAVKNHGTSEVTLDATYTLAAEMKPWVSVYELVLTMDGKALETHPTVSASGDTVHVTARGWCDGTSTKTPNHLLTLKGSMPFATTLETAATSLVFSCPGTHIVTPTPVALTPPASTDDGGAATAPTVGSTHGGCSMGAANGGDGALTGAGLLLGLAMVVRRTKKGAK